MGKVHLNTSVGCWWLIVIVVNSRGKEVRTTYRVSDSRPDPRVASPAWTLEKVPESGPAEVWHVSVRDGEVSCDCQSANWRKSCKHCKALAAAGFITNGRKL